ncbi:MAG: hypothetical protein COZ28_01920 [Candidatus Moranbacteria bacterium CG_4_10_14_3_um_filter_44_15]|nr:MAG: hypothetical protein COS72_00430 [Candidatus Moranbacteria bacterium CG06_land_8_20_14_3_00_43_56]PIV83505.1 MAG: hypothetical protein COW51_04190 [Candidatus Moranbacteria bacterium CG17_big_fil_post_rev_8_21_14_2_50_44_12]PIW93369.1 MAG: hypothetical protein COZ87_01570 [Candidatus Moranbacteria bacterium CG_4_8_14_3_um_filter_43_15]PIX90778.1 MAG: hypothetical protein COZ28_01920 [Candidatus Moranbacteria bacterium CG_4_10_14_3_um_filter_44_15]PJA86370.1 MAG: hypothetical protein CO1
MEAREVSDRQMFVAIQKFLRAEKKANIGEANNQIYNFFKRWIAIKLKHDRRIPLVVISGKKRLKISLHLCESCKGSGQDPSGFMRAFRRDNICPYCFLGSGVASIAITYNGQIIKRPLPNSGLFVKGI